MRAERDVLVGHVRRDAWQRVGHGLYRRRGVEHRPAGVDLAELLAWQEVLPASACLTHLTAAALRGLWLPPLPEGLPLFVSQSERLTRAKRPEIRVMRHTRPIAWSWLHGLRVAEAEEVLLVCARHLSLVDLVVLGDSALHQGLVSPASLRAATERRRWGSSRLARSLEWMDGRAESAWETLLRLLHRSCGVDVVPQHVVRDETGGFVARGDLWIRGSRVLQEYDGAQHRTPEEYARGLDRDRRLLAAGWHRRGYVARDLLGRPERVLRDADLTLGRPHRPDRLDTWLSLHEESLFGAGGEARLAARLARGTSGRELR